MLPTMKRSHSTHSQRTDADVQPGGEDAQWPEGEDEILAKAQSLLKRQVDRNGPRRIEADAGADE